MTTCPKEVLCGIICNIKAPSCGENKQLYDTTVQKRLRGSLNWHFATYFWKPSRVHLGMYLVNILGAVYKLVKHTRKTNLVPSRECCDSPWTTDVREMAWQNISCLPRHNHMMRWIHLNFHDNQSLHPNLQQFSCVLSNAQLSQHATDMPNEEISQFS